MFNSIVGGFGGFIFVLVGPSELVRYVELEARLPKDLESDELRTQFGIALINALIWGLGVGKQHADNLFTESLPPNARIVFKDSYGDVYKITGY